MTMKEPSDTAHESLEKKHDMDLEDALDLVGVGRYQYFHCVLMLTTLEAAIFEIIGSAFILPAAACDLGLSDEMRGLIACIPSIGIILTTPFWGRLADKYGRKPVLTATCACAGLAGLMAALMPNLLTFAICQFVASLFLTSPSSLGFAYAGEMVPRKQRDRAVLICSGLLSFLAALCPILAWIVLSFNWQFYVGTLSLRPWRLLTAVYAVPLILTAIWMTQAKESPKFLVSTDKPEQALEVLRHIFVKNTGLPVEEYSVSYFYFFIA
ncbi:synaptic vesicle glycoprotein 2B-like [Hyposmocoma kahamanoa]|uniref:synaptic vesicle glycoprotein 2B-like n=1 Tax=Hyposmocoma kahamanoa TaxID=1477025 RepID=UPI000E6D6D7A|nr:synaptic vesicle glycoprotein 2B-like [Hyposmocoma kahamanoa]